MTAIVDVFAREILDSRGNPTVEVDVTLADGTLGVYTFAGGGVVYAPFETATPVTFAPPPPPTPTVTVTPSELVKL